MARCPSCEIMNINGVRTHEIGCPDAWKDYTRECTWCGSRFKPEEKDQTCCSHSCFVAYNNLSCDCDECRTPENISSTIGNGKRMNPLLILSKGETL